MLIVLHHVLFATISLKVRDMLPFQLVFMTFGETYKVVSLRQKSVVTSLTFFRQKKEIAKTYVILIVMKKKQKKTLIDI